MSRHEKIDVESFIDGFIQSIEGQRIDDNLPQEVNFNNADYVINFAEHLIELKCLDENQIENNSFLRNVFNRHQEHWSYLNSVEAKSKTPEKLARETVDKFKVEVENAMYSRIKKIITKANKQLRETKDYFGYEDYSGTIWIVNDNNTALSIESQVNLVSRVLNGSNYSNIQSVVLSNVNMHVVSESKTLPHLFWVPVFRDSADEKVQGLMYFLGECWKIYLSKNYPLKIDLDNAIDTKEQGLDYLYKFMNLQSS
ncbi:hypothetical protein MD535_25045 [Vibrio sp. ZSDZ65]|uniref:Uncharacterized protein n=1 Tax=Vibrio qingdaonensis TaxID=2829491 RepID=A0A9X3HZE5_9VIBR|nr:hypothetical protein [Vibrio qingdaonensis]MCW8349253.1 hypothetical protein [Vibrio qingdaonensis]